MRKRYFGSFSFASVLVATALVAFDSQVAMACNSAPSSGSGFSHGSSLGSGSVTVCVGSSSGSPGSTTTRTVSKTVIIEVPEKPKSSPVPKTVITVPPKPGSVPSPKPATKPAPIRVQVSCPSFTQIASMPRSADAAERWIQSICALPAKVTVVSKPTPTLTPIPRTTPKPKPKSRTVIVTEVITVEEPGSFYSSNDAAMFYPNPLRAIVNPETVVAVGQKVNFSSNPTAHFRISQVLGRQAQVHFVPANSGWSFSDGVTKTGADTNRSFGVSGNYQVEAWVSYKVSYRVLGETSWQPIAGELITRSNSLEVLVGALYLRGDSGGRGALLVGAECSAKSRAFGCEI